MILNGKRRIRFLAIALSVILLLAVLSTTVYADDFTNNDNNQNIYDRIDEYLSDTIPKTHFPSFSITIVDNDETLLSKTYGSGGSPDTPYVLGSVSKSFTALCIMQLVEQGKVSLDAHLSDYLPEATDGDRITILQLLNHTSGLGEHQNLTNFRIVSEQGVHLYANVNYSLLGEVIEAVSGTSYEEYVTENVIEPLGMNNTYADPDKATGLIKGNENWFGFNVKTDTQYCDTDDTWITVPAGYITSSTEDLGRYLQMYLNGGENILSPESINEMFYNSIAVEDEIPYSYGMGWTLINEPLKRSALRHSGLVETGMSCIYILPDDNIGVAMTINTNDYFVGTDFADRVGWGVILILMGDEPNQIGANEYVMRHLMYDGIYLAILVVALLPFIMIGRYKKRLLKGRNWRTAIWVIALHVAFPTFILMLTGIFFKTPLWVVKAFVPDLFAVIIASACLLFAGGVLKAILFINPKVALDKDAV
jgi:CubicO group peptidase (beta-lactamase class C family)